LAARGATLDLIGLRLADLCLWLDARESGVRMLVPACYTPFLTSGPPRDGLILRVREGAPRSTEGWRSIFYDAETWQLWRDDAGSQVFVTSRHSPPRRQIVVDADYRVGQVVGEFGASGASGEVMYPLQDIDMVLYANWLAQSGDLIVHAAGIDHQGEGYIFVGPSGAGKSTLAARLSSGPEVTVLGEDQVILRRLGGRFVVYGTPWHTNPARCSSGGIPLKKLFFLDRTGPHRVEPCAPRAGIERLLQDGFVPYYNRAGVVRILDNLARLAEEVAFYTLSFQLEADVMHLIREA